MSNQMTVAFCSLSLQREYVLSRPPTAGYWSLTSHNYPVYFIGTRIDVLFSRTVYYNPNDMIDAVCATEPSLQVAQRAQPEPLATTTKRGYPVFYVTTNDKILCPACANIAAQLELCIAQQDTNFDDNDLHCIACAQRIPSAYTDVFPIDKYGLAIGR